MKSEWQMTPDELEDRYTGLDGWGEHPVYGVEDWRRDVADHSTRAGYWVWVRDKLVSEV